MGLAAFAAIALWVSARAEEPYVEASGSAYLETDYRPGPETRIEVDFQILDTNTTQPRVFGVEDSSSLCSGFYVNSAKNWAFCHKDGAWASVTMGAADTERHTVILDSYDSQFFLITGGVTNETKSIPWTRTKTSARVLHLFGQNDASFDYGLAKERIYSARIYEKGVLVRDYAPCVRNGLVGLRDKVAGGFLYSRDGANLTAGGDIETITVADAYLQSTGSTYVDTGYFPTPETRIEADFEMLSLTANNTTDKQPRIGGSNGLRYVLYVNGSSYFAFSAFDSVNGPKSGKGYQTGTSYQADVGVRHTFFVDQYRDRAALTTAGKDMCAYKVETAMTNLTVATQQLYIFGSTDWNQKAQMKLYSFKIYEKDALIHDYVPQVKDRVVGLGDRVTGGFLAYPSGSVGGDIQTDAYLVSDGTQGIVSDYFANPKTKIEADFSFEDVATKQQRIFGADSDNTANPLSCSLYLNGGGSIAYAFKDGVGNWSGLCTAATNARYIVTLDGPNSTATVAGAATKSATIDTTRTGTSVNPLGIFCDYENGKFCRTGAKIRLYSLSCYEDGVLVRRYLPYKSGDAVGLYETQTRRVFLSTRAGSTAFGIGGAGFSGSGTALLVKPDDARARRSRPAVLKAFAPGAVAYRWFAEGEEIAGETGAELAVAWREGPRYASYAVVPVFQLGNTRVEGERATCTVDFMLRGFAVIVK